MEKKRTKHLRSKLILWSGMLLIGILAIPAGILITLISLIGIITDKAAGRMERREEIAESSGSPHPLRLCMH